MAFFNTTSLLTKETSIQLFDNFQELTYKITTKTDGNIAFHVGDNTNDVLQRHAKLAQSLHYDQNNLIHMKQIHSDRIHRVTQEDTFEAPHEVDALITNIKGKALMVMVADCTPLLAYDPKHKVIAVAHVGRAGAFLNIVSKLIDTFINHYNSNPQEIYVMSAPSIASSCYEVSHAIVQEAQEYNYGFAIEQKDNRYYLDIRAIISHQLLEKGILAQNTQLSSICNCCHTDRYYSYRKEGQTGRFGAILML